MRHGLAGARWDLNVAGFGLNRRGRFADVTSDCEEAEAFENSMEILVFSLFGTFCLWCRKAFAPLQ